MSVSAFVGAGGQNAGSLEELHKLLADKYDEKGVLQKRLHRGINCRNLSGIAWLTPSDLITRFNDHISRRFEDMNIKETDYHITFRTYYDFMFLVTPTVSNTRDVTLTLFLVDSEDPTSVLHGDQEVDLSSVDGPQVVCFSMGYSVVNSDRTSVGGSESHRRIGLCWDIDVGGDTSSSTNTTTFFSVKASWHRKLAMKPSYYKVGPPVVIPIDVGFREHVVTRNPQILKQFIRAGIDVTRHVTAASHVSNSVSLLQNDKPKALDAKSLDVIAKRRRPRPRTARSRSRGVQRPEHNDDQMSKVSDTSYISDDIS